MKLLPLFLLALTMSSSPALADSAATVEPLPFGEFKRIAGERAVTVDSATKTAILDLAKRTEPVPPQIASVADKLRTNEPAISLEALMPLLEPERGQTVSEQIAKHDDPLVRFAGNIVLAASGNSDAARTAHALIHDDSLAQADKRLIRTWCDGVGIRAASDDANAIFDHLSSAMSKEPRIRKGDTAPSFVTETTEGHQLSSRQLSGKVVVLHFWATWCGPCVARMPSHIEALAEYDSKRVEIVYVSLDEDKDAFDAAIKKHAVPFKNVREESGWGGNLARAFGVNSVPFDIVIGKDGRLFSNSIGDIDAALVAESVQSEDDGRTKR
jgi:thiol-disulfide isomerase/thioredoxin